MSEKIKNILGITCFCISLIFGVYVLAIQDINNTRIIEDSTTSITVEMSSSRLV